MISIFVVATLLMLVIWFGFLKDKKLSFQISQSSEEEDSFNLESEHNVSKYGWFESARLETSLDLEDFRYPAFNEKSSIDERCFRYFTASACQSNLGGSRFKLTGIGDGYFVMLYQKTYLKHLKLWEKFYPLYTYIKYKYLTWMIDFLSAKWSFPCV